MCRICFAWFLCRRKDSRVDVFDQFCLVLRRRKDSRVDDPGPFCLAFVQEEGFEG